MNNFKKLIGKKCIYVNGEFQTIDDFNAIDCTIEHVDLIVEDKWPYTACVIVKLAPVHWDHVDSATLEDMQDGVGLENIADIEQ
jgi:hypothetical protein